MMSSIKITRLRGGLSAAIGLALLAPAAAEAQSLFAGRGLGYAAEALDARARGLGSTGIGLPEGSLSFTNPAGISGVQAPALHITVQPDRFTADFGASEVSGGTVRFPLIHVALPFRRWTASVGYASYLDRNWAVQRDTTLQINGTDVRVGDRFASHGGVARLRFGAAYDITPRLSIGAAVDRYTGVANDTTSRDFLDDVMRPAVETTQLDFGGIGYGGGIRWMPSDALAVGLAVTAGGRLEVQNSDPEIAEARYDLPLQASAGVGGRVTPTTLVAISGTWAGWSSVDSALPDAGAARDTWTVGAGIEWEAIRRGASVVPLRLGVRRSELPFRWDAGNGGDGWALERAISMGTGIRLGGGMAMLDAAVDRGSRGDAEIGISESFWRISLSLTMLGR